MFYSNNNGSPVDLTGLNTTFYQDVQYGRTNREVLDIFIPNDAVSPTGLVINIGGGGFIENEKDALYTGGLQTKIQNFLGDNTAYCLINYDLIETEIELIGLINSLISGQFAVQFLKFHHILLNLDKTNFVIKGSSAGAGIAMWLAYGPDRADAGSTNNILKESTAIKAVTLSVPQATYDLKKWETIVYADLGYSIDNHYNNSAGAKILLHRTYGITSLADFYLEPTITERADVDMLQFITNTGGVETYISNSNSLATGLLGDSGVNNINHDPRHAKVIKDALEAQGTTTVSYISAYGISDPSGETENNFIKRKISE
jgi:hypothetical protein